MRPYQLRGISRTTGARRYTTLPKILVTRDLGQPAMAKLRGAERFELIENPEDAEPSREWVLEKIADPDLVAACIMHAQKSDVVDDELLRRAGKGIKVISTFSVGFDHIDVKAANARGIKIGHTPGVVSDAVADTTVMLALMALRRVEEGIQLVKSGNWPSLPWAPFNMCGSAISAPGLTIGFIGFGRISQAVVDRLIAFTNKTEKANIIYSNSRVRENQAAIDTVFTNKWGIKVARGTPEEVAEKSDIVIVLSSLNPSTANIINAAFLKRMKKTAVLVNAARGAVLNNDDLNAALDAGELAGAALDVISGEPFIDGSHPLVVNKKCVVIPHMGNADYLTRHAMGDMCARNAIAGAKGEELIAEVKV